MDKDKKIYYWIMLKEDFFDDDAIKVIENMENGKSYVLFLLKLYLKSTKKNGYLRLTDAIPYNPKTLSVLTDVNIDIVDKAIKIFQEFGLLTVQDDGTIYMNRIKELVGSETHSAVRKRLYREQSKALEDNGIQSNWDNVPCVSQECRTEIRDYRLELELNKESMSTYSCSEQKSCSKPNMEKIQFSFTDRCFNNIPDKTLSLWADAYPAIDINAELNAMSAWLLANPKNRKSNYERFIINWLKRSQDRARRV